MKSGRIKNSRPTLTNLSNDACISYAEYRLFGDLQLTSVPGQRLSRLLPNLVIVSNNIFDWRIRLSFNMSWGLVLVALETLHTVPQLSSTFLYFNCLMALSCFLYSYNCCCSQPGFCHNFISVL